MKESEIQKILENLGGKVSILAEENRTCKNREDAAKQLIKLIGKYISIEDWNSILNETDDIFIKEIMKEWTPKEFINNDKK
tara:strand:- start:670 stop:912 length:243 start_codon:yes stop_codon:yes gene_type:complete